MHELGIVFHIIDSVKEIAAGYGLTSVSSVTLQIGEVSGIIPGYLLDCWRWACEREELMRGCELVTEEIPAVTYCEACERTYATVEHGRTCPWCGSGQTYLLRGNEAIIKEIATPDEGPADAGVAGEDAAAEPVPGAGMPGEAASGAAGSCETVTGDADDPDGVASS